MKTFDMCQFIRQRITTVAAESFNYTEWSDKFAAKNIRDIPQEIKALAGFKKIDPSDLTAQEMDKLNFGIWDASEERRFIPLWLLPFLVDEFMATNIHGENINSMIKRDNIDNDHRFGYLAYGVIPLKEGEI